MNAFVKTLFATLLGAAPVALCGTGAAGVIPASDDLSGWDAPQESRGPGYQLYRDGYRLILGEHWGEARRKFAELMRRHPRSNYIDDARFWTAYSWKFSDRKKALEAYAQFMKDFPSSNYFDDAVAEYQRLGGEPGAVRPDNLAGIPEAAARIAQMEKRLAEIQRQFLAQMPRPPRIPAVPPGEEPRIRTKVEALRALMRSPEDTAAFAALRETTFDTTQHPSIRLAALDAARRFRVPGVTPFLLTVVEQNADVRFRMMALDGLRVSSATEGTAVLTAVRALALNQEEIPELRMAALQVLEQKDREEFPGMLVQIAKSDRHKPLQISALRYLGNQRQGGRQAVEVLRDVALDGKCDPDLREAALFGLQQLSGPEAHKILIETAKTDPQERIRLAAIYSLGSSSHEDSGPLIPLLEELAADRSQPRLVRQTALAQLGFWKGSLDARFLASLASGEPDEEIQEMVIHVLGLVVQEKANSFSVLTSLFGSIPPDRIRSRDVLLFSVASIGNDDAVGFLSTVAKENSNEALRQRAIFYLGNIGSDKARNALLDILRAP